MDEDQFLRLCHELITPQLASFGFLSAGEQREEYKGGLRIRSIIFRRAVPGAEPHYLLVQRVTIVCNTPPDLEWVQVMLGEGKDEGTEANFNSTSIWYVTTAATGREDTTGYTIRTGDTAAAALTFAAQELRKHAGDFLAGDLRSFRRVRAQQNSEPRSYPADMCGLDGQPLDEAGRRSLINTLEALQQKYT